MFAIRLSKTFCRSTCLAHSTGFGHAFWSTSLMTRQPSTHSWTEARSEPTRRSTRRRHHVEAEQAVELVGGDLRLVGFPEARALSHGKVLDRGAPGDAARGEEAPLWLRHPDRDLVHALDGRRPQELLELGVPPDPDLRAVALGLDDRRRGGGGHGAGGTTAGAGAWARSGRAASPIAATSRTLFMGRPFGNAWVRVYTAASVCSNAPVSPWPGPSSDSFASSAATFPAGCCSSPTSSW